MIYSIYDSYSIPKFSVIFMRDLVALVKGIGELKQPIPPKLLPKDQKRLEDRRKLLDFRISLAKTRLFTSICLTVSGIFAISNLGKIVTGPISFIHGPFWRLTCLGLSILIYTISHDVFRIHCNISKHVPNPYLEKDIKILCQTFSIAAKDNGKVLCLNSHKIIEYTFFYPLWNEVYKYKGSRLEKAVTELFISAADLQNVHLKELGLKR